MERAHGDQLVKDRPGAIQRILQQVYQYWGIPRQTDKAVSREFQVEDLGSLLDGLLGAMKTPHKFDIELATATYWFVRQPNPAQNNPSNSGNNNPLVQNLTNPERNVFMGFPG